MNSKAAVGLSAGALLVGLLAGLALGGDGKDEQRDGVGPGPTKTVAGVPVGYQRSKAGAVRAALAYQAALGNLADTKSTSTEILDAIASGSDRQSISEAMDPGLEVVRKAISLNGYVRSGSVGYELKEYNSDTAEILIWGVSVLYSAGIPGPQSGWTTTILRLKWADGDWKLAAAPKGEDGPTPILRESPSEPGPLTSFVASLQGTGHVPAD